eukprot:9370326-Lingulodinium_polyedra.AAC.1
MLECSGGWTMPRDLPCRLRGGGENLQNFASAEAHPAYRHNHAISVARGKPRCRIRRLHRR